MTAKELDLPSLHERADSLAALAHYGKFDKIGEPYIDHPRTVAAYAVEMLPEFERCQMQVLDPVRVATIALLHDTVEDTWVTAEILRGLFPVSVVEDVLTLTQDGPSRDPAARARYIQGIMNCRSLYPMLVKVADLRHNTDIHRMRALSSDYSRGQMAQKYTKDVAGLELDKSPFAGYFYHLEDFLPENQPTPEGATS